MLGANNSLLILEEPPEFIKVVLQHDKLYACFLIFFFLVRVLALYSRKKNTIFERERFVTNTN